jgi:hypothetical protein
VCVYHNPADAYQQNDTICFRQEFTDYYAYDDGSAERAIGIQSQGGMIALRYQAAIEDTLIGLRIHWTPYGRDVSNNPFLLRIWNDGGGIPGSEIVENFTFHNPDYYQDGYDIFSYYAYDQPLAVSGTFYVGWVQSDDVPYYVGNDKNRDNNTGKMFVMLQNNVWEQVGITGSIMVRPVFKSRKTPIVNVNEQDTARLEIYPNPANDQVIIAALPNGDATIEVLDFSGRIVHTERSFGQSQVTLDTSEMADGVYVIRVVDAFSRSYTQRVIVRH